MAHTVNFGAASKRSGADLEHKQLEVEKVGVIGGFLLGLVLAVGHVSEFLQAHGASDLLIDVGMFATVAVTTFVGTRIASAIASRLGASR